MAQAADVKKLAGSGCGGGGSHGFRKASVTIETYTPRSDTLGDAEYLRNYVDNNIIFTKEVMDKQLSAVTDTPSALDFAMQRELDSILYYHEIKNLVPQAQHETIEKIIEEERKHYAMLLDAKKKYTS